MLVIINLKLQEIKLFKTRFPATKFWRKDEDGSLKIHKTVFFNKIIKLCENVFVLEHIVQHSVDYVVGHRRKR